LSRVSSPRQNSASLKKTTWWQSVYRVVPNIPDHPYLQAPFNIETLSINETGDGARRRWRCSVCPAADALRHFRRLHCTAWAEIRF